MAKKQLPLYKKEMKNYKESHKSLYKLPFARLIYKNLLEPLLNFLVEIDPSYKYHSIGLITDKNCDFMKEPDFIKAWNKKTAQSPDWKTSKMGQWITHVNQWAVSHAKNLEGDFVECGVYRGNLAMFNLTYLDFAKMKNRKYYLFDTFCGLDKDWSTEEEYEYWKEKYPNTYEFVKKSFEKYPNVIITKGTVPLSLSKVNIKKVAYLSIDMNCVLPEKKALEFFWPKMVSGGIIVLDDYGWPGSEGEKLVMDKFALSKGVKIFSVPTGQGIIIKP